MTTMGGATRWLVPLIRGVPGLTELDTLRLRHFEESLGGLLASHPIGPDVEQRLRSQRLARIRRELAACGLLAVAVPAQDGDQADRR